MTTHKAPITLDPSHITHHCHSCNNMPRQISFDDAPDTAGMTPLQLEFSGKVAFFDNRLVTFVPFIVG